MRRFDGKNVLLTGAASGMGRAAAIRLTSEGAAVFGVDVNRAGLDETAGLIPEGPGRFTVHVADVSDESAVIAAVQAAVAEFDGRIDVLANVAGIQRTTPLATLTAAGSASGIGKALARAGRGRDRRRPQGHRPRHAGRAPRRRRRCVSGSTGRWTWSWPARESAAPVRPCRT